eukprot:4801622-Prymnesium_polylepis.1
MSALALIERADETVCVASIGPRNELRPSILLRALRPQHEARDGIFCTAFCEVQRQRQRRARSQHKAHIVQVLLARDHHRYFGVIAQLNAGLEREHSIAALQAHLQTYVLRLRQAYFDTQGSNKSPAGSKRETTVQRTPTVLRA